jgi:hypothetical protein
MDGRWDMKISSRSNRLYSKKARAARCSTMYQLKQRIIQESLADVREQIGKAETILSHGDHLAALHRLLQSRKDLRQAVVTLMVECLRENQKAIDGESQLSLEKRLRDLTEVVDFALLALCADCQHQIGVDLKEA